MYKGLGAIIAATAGASSFGGQVTPATMTATAQMQVTSGNLVGCGLRVVALAQDQSTTVTAADFSFTLYRSGQALVKAGLREASMTNAKEIKLPKIRQIEGFWLRAVGQTATTPNEAGVTRSESPKGYLLYPASHKSVAGLFGAAFNGQIIQVGYRITGQFVETILSGTIKVTGTELNEASQCLSELLEAMTKDADAKSSGTAGKN